MITAHNVIVHAPLGTIEPVITCQVDVTTGQWSKTFIVEASIYDNTTSMFNGYDVPVQPQQHIIDVALKEMFKPEHIKRFYLI